MPPSSQTVLELEQSLFHIPISEHHHRGLVESINALLHVNNGSHSGSGNGLTHPTPEEEISEDLVIILFTVVPLVITIAVIFLIAVTIRKMRRSESLQDVMKRTEFQTSTIAKAKKGTSSLKSNPLESLSFYKKSKSSKTAPPSPLSLHEIRVIPISSSRNRPLSTQLSLDSTSSSSASECSQCHSIATSPTSLNYQAPPWYLHSTPYYRSQYHLNKLQRQLSNNSAGGGSLKSFGSVQSLNQAPSQCNHSSSSNDSTLTRSNSNWSDPELSDGATTEEKKKKSKKLKKVVQLMNFPKRIRQHQAEKNRFNIYTMPNETREQLKQIYVY